MKELHHSDIRDRLMVSVHRLVKEAERVYGDKFNNNYSIEFYTKGQAPSKLKVISQDCVQICFNLKLLLHYGQTFIDLVVPHEVAHLVMHFCYPGTSGHGSYWRDIMKVFHAPITLDFGFDPAVVLDEVYEYTCGFTCNKIYKVSKRKHNNIQAGKIYTCPSCKRMLRLMEKE